MNKNLEDLVMFLNSKSAYISHDNHLLESLSGWLSRKAGLLDISGSREDVHDAALALNKAVGSDD